MAKPILIANWKNNPSSLSEAQTLLRQLARNSRLYKNFSLIIAPPLPYFESVVARCRSFARLASQDISSKPDGTHTGEVTADILKSFGVQFSIIGHSERRALGETDELVSQKVKIALRSSITPVVCVGELSRDQDGEHFEFLRVQMKLSLAGLNKKSDAMKLIIAYEPVWAVGKQAKGVIEPADLSQSVLFIKKVLTDMFGRTVADQITILYGGSVDRANAQVLFRETGIKGFLVGRASLDPKSFKAIAESVI